MLKLTLNMVLQRANTVLPYQTPVQRRRIELKGAEVVAVKQWLTANFKHFLTIRVNKHGYAVIPAASSIARNACSITRSSAPGLLASTESICR